MLLRGRHQRGPGGAWGDKVCAGREEGGGGRVVVTQLGVKEGRGGEKRPACGEKKPY